MSDPHLTFDTLDQVFTHLWQQLTRGAADTRHPFHWPVIGNTSPHGCSLRTVVLRDVISHTRTLRCHTDRRAGKFSELHADPRLSWLFYNPRQRIQLRAAGTVTLHTEGPVFDTQWQHLSAQSQRGYATQPAPGRPIAEGSAFAFDDTAPAQHFAVVDTTVDFLEWLWLGRDGHRRARFMWRHEAWQPTWLAP